MTFVRSLFLVSILSLSFSAIAANTSASKSIASCTDPNESDPAKDPQINNVSEVRATVVANEPICLDKEDFPLYTDKLSPKEEGEVIDAVNRMKKLDSSIDSQSKRSLIADAMLKFKKDKQNKCVFGAAIQMHENHVLNSKGFDSVKVEGLGNISAPAKLEAAMNKLAETDPNAKIYSKAVVELYKKNQHRNLSSLMTEKGFQSMLTMIGPGYKVQLEALRNKLLDLKSNFNKNLRPPGELTACTDRSGSLDFNPELNFSPNDQMDTSPEEVRFGFGESFIGDAQSLTEKKIQDSLGSQLAEMKKLDPDRIQSACILTSTASYKPKDESLTNRDLAKIRAEYTRDSILKEIMEKAKATPDQIKNAAENTKLNFNGTNKNADGEWSGTSGDCPQYAGPDGQVKNKSWVKDPKIETFAASKARYVKLIIKMKPLPRKIPAQLNFRAHDGKSCSTPTFTCRENLLFEENNSCDGS